MKRKPKKSSCIQSARVPIASMRRRACDVAVPSQLVLVRAVLQNRSRGRRS